MDVDLGKGWEVWGPIGVPSLSPVPHGYTMMILSSLSLGGRQGSSFRSVLSFTTLGTQVLTGIRVPDVTVRPVW